MMGELLNHLVGNDAFTQPPDEPFLVRNVSDATRAHASFRC